MKKIQNLTRLPLLAAALVATFLFAGPASAQNAYAGKFTLPQEVRWGQAVLPPAEYEFRLNRGGMNIVITVHSRDQKISAFVMPTGVSDRNAKAPSALIIETRGNETTVRSLRLAEPGLVLDFGSEKSHGRKVIQEARSTQELPVLVAKK